MRGWVIAMLAVFAASTRGAAATAGALPTPPPGWTIEVVGSSPAVRHPSVVCCAPDGRVFVAEDPMDISLPAADARRGRILCVHPGGRTTVFADGLHAVFGMQYLDGRLYVLHNPKFTVFSDDDGVGKDPRDLIECTNPNPWALNWNDHVPANFHLAMDGCFYVAVGDKGLYGAVGTDGRRVDLRGGGVIRLRPDGSGLEVFSTGVRNILDVAINDEDELFTYDNTDEHDWMGRLTHMVDGGFYGYPYDFVPRRPYTLWMMADYGAGAATGAACYTDDALPAEYRGNLFLADFGKRNVLRVRVEREGATYKAVSRQDLFTDVPADFRPVGICFSADGAGVYVCDWQHADTKEEVAVGRLLKMTFSGAAERERPRWYEGAASGRTFVATDDELIGALSHPSHAVRLVAQRRLADRGEKVAGRLRDLLRAAGTRGGTRGGVRVHALWALDAIDGGVAARTEIIRATRDADPRVRRQVLRQLGGRRVGTALPAVLGRLIDHDPSVRFHAASAAGRIGDASAVPALLGSLGDVDPWTRYAIQRALNRLGRANPVAWPDIAHGLRDDAEVVRTGVAFALRDTYDTALVAAVAEIADDCGASAASRAAAVGVLGPLHRALPEWKGEWWAYHPALGNPPRKDVEWAGTSQVLRVVRAALDQPDAIVRDAALDAAEEARDAGAAEALRALFAGATDARLKRRVAGALARCDDGHSAAFLMRHLTDRARDASLDADVLRALGRLRATAAVPLMAEYARRPGEALPAAAFAALVDTGGPEATAALIELLGDRSSDVRLGAVRAAGEIGGRALVPPLLVAYAARETRPAALAALARMPDARAVDAYLDGLASPEFALRERCKAAIREIRDAALPAVEALVKKAPSDEVVLELQELYKDHAAAKAGPLFRIAVSRKHPGGFVEFAVGHGGDAGAGLKLFGEARAGGAGCAACHTVDGRGGTVGPDLSGVGDKYSRRDLAEAVVYPGKAVREGYQQVIVRTRRGQSYAGPLKAETADELTLQEADGTVRTIAKPDIAARKDTGLSPMPEGLHTGITEQQFADLVSYLESLRTTPAAAGKDTP